MGKIRERRLARWERIRQSGMLRFTLTRGLSFGILLGLTVYIFSDAPLPWYILFPLFCLGGLLWGAAMWFVTMWQYNRARRQS